MVRRLTYIATLFALAPVPALAYTLNGYTFNDRPTGTGKPNIVVMVHGWNSSATDWPTSMGSAIVNQLTLAGRANQWDTWSYDWASDASSGGVTPSEALLRNAQVHGQHLADWLIRQTAGGGYQHVHLMSHSLGGRVIETAAVKLHQVGLTLHQTFLDAYTPKAWEAVYGENADYAEHYYNDDVFIIETQDDFANAHNIDVTDDGGPGGLTFGSGHSWPYQWYRNTVNNGGVAPQGYGYALSKEYVGDNWHPPTNRPPGYLVDLPGGAPPGSVAAQRRITRARKSYNSIVNAGDELTLNAGQTINLPINTSDVGSTNYLDFRFDFASHAGGSLTVQVDGTTLTYEQEAFALLNRFEWSGKLMIGSDLSAGNHTITFSLAGGDSVALDDISLGYYRDIGSQSPGDADVDGDVDLADLGRLASFYGQAFGMDWDRGDFDLDGDVDLADLGALASHYGAGAAQAFADFQALTGVPEPAGAAAFILAMLAACRLLSRRRASATGGAATFPGEEPGTLSATPP